MHDHRTTRATPLQHRLNASFGLLEQARLELDAGGYQTYIAILLERVHNEAERLVIAEAHHATRQAAGH